MSEQPQQIVTKINWPLMLSIISPLIMVVGLVGTAAVAKHRLDSVTSYLNPEWIAGYGRLQQRVDHLEKIIDRYEQLLDERSFNDPVKGDD